MSSSDKTQSNWIICKSGKQCPHRVYYFNTSTGVSQWKAPKGEDVDKLIYDPPNNPSEAHSAIKKDFVTSSPNETLCRSLESTWMADQSGSSSESNFDLRKVINQKKYLKMDDRTPVSTKNIAQNRMERLRNALAHNLEASHSEGLERISVSPIRKNSDAFVKNKYPLHSCDVLSKNNVLVCNRKRKVEDNSDNKELARDNAVYAKSDVKKKVSINDRLKRKPHLHPNKNSSDHLPPRRTNCSEIINHLPPNGVKCPIIDDDVDMKEIDDPPQQPHEDMEWEPISEERILESIIDIRKVSVNLGIPTVQPVEKKNSDKTKLHIIVDTNIFLSNLSFVQFVLLEYNYENLGKPVVVVPWIVLQELDYIKDRSNSNDDNKQLAYLARKAINYLNDSFVERSEKLYGQSAIDSSNELINTDCPDDKILNCCLQTLNRVSNVVLLSNDKNLRSKCLVTNIRAYSKDEILSSLAQRNGYKNLVHEQSTSSGNKKRFEDNFQTSAIAKAPNISIKKDKTDDIKRIELYLTEVLNIYISYSGAVIEIYRAYNSGSVIEKNSTTMRLLPKMIKNLLLFLDLLPNVILEPFYFVKVQSLENFAKFIENILVDNNFKCATITLNTIGNFCRTERDQLLAVQTRLKSVLTVLQRVQYAV